MLCLIFSVCIFYLLFTRSLCVALLLAGGQSSNAQLKLVDAWFDYLIYAFVEQYVLEYIGL